MLFEKSRVKFALIVGSFLLAAGLPAQTVSSVRIYTDPAGLEFSVDGQIYKQAVTLLWPQGSKHSIVVASVQTMGEIPTQYGLETVISNLGPIDNLSSITADPNLTFIELPFEPNYAVDLNFFVCTTGANCANICPPSTNCPGPGYVILNNQAYTQNVQIFVPVGQPTGSRSPPESRMGFRGLGDIAEFWQHEPGVPEHLGNHGADDASPDLQSRGWGNGHGQHLARRFANTGRSHDLLRADQPAMGPGQRPSGWAESLRSTI